MANTEPVIRETMEPLVGEHARGTAACSLCGRSKQDVDRLVAGSHGFICDACVRRCAAVLDEESRRG